MRVLIVHAHPEPASFAAALMRAARDELLQLGHEVEVSDLYALGFDPVSDRRNFRSVLDPLRYRQQAEEAHAASVGGFAPELTAEMEKVARCEVLLLSFPIWWLGMPAILKGWVDRVFAAGVAYGGGRVFERGVMRGKRAMVVVTTGGLEREYDGTGAYDRMERVLYPVHRGILEFTGFEVLAPFVSYGPGRIPDGHRARDLEALRERMRGLAPAGHRRGPADAA